MRCDERELAKGARGERERERKKRRKEKKTTAEGDSSAHTCSSCCGQRTRHGGRTVVRSFDVRVGSRAIVSGRLCPLSRRPPAVAECCALRSLLYTGRSSSLLYCHELAPRSSPPPVAVVRRVSHLFVTSSTTTLRAPSRSIDSSISLLINPFSILRLDDFSLSFTIPATSLSWHRHSTRSAGMIC
uniref:Uncharacterized protein n=1 Tax=Plectus sambesii TaxID=2011161 RepID=A0A914UVF4_9BILA